MKCQHAQRGGIVVVASRRISPIEERPDHKASCKSAWTCATSRRSDGLSTPSMRRITGSSPLHPTSARGGAFMDADMHGARSYMEGKFLGSWDCARYGAPYRRPQCSRLASRSPEVEMQQVRP